MGAPEVSVIIRCRNEWPLVATTMHSYIDDLETSKIPYEIIVVSNCADDSTPDILLDKYRRWTRAGLLKVVEFNDRASHWGAANAGFEASSGRHIVISDGHVSIGIGTIEKLLSGARTNGGIWHAAEQQWNDTSRIRTYQYDLRLYDRFWGFRCRHVPPSGFLPPVREGDIGPYSICMAPHCLLLVAREEIDRFGLYTPPFATYGGGEPYLAMKWWMMGSGVWLDPTALCRHAFGWRARWHTLKKAEKRRSPVLLKSGKFSSNLSIGDEFLAYSKGYDRPNYEFHENFSMAAYTIGGITWMDHILDRFQVSGVTRVKMRRKILRECMADHVFIRDHATRTLNDLVENPPWMTCKIDGHGDTGTFPEEVRNDGLRQAQD